jgi:hypothetical protein
MVRLNCSGEEMIKVRTMITVSVGKGEAFTLRDLRTLVKRAAGISDDARVTLAQADQGSTITVDSAR